MQKVIVNCQESQKKNGIIHALKVNNYKPIEFVSKNEVILLMELHDYMKTHNCILSVNVCHKISFYE